MPLDNRPTPGANAATAALYQAARSAYTPVHAAGTAYAKAYQQVLAATDLVDAMGRMVAVILAAEHLKAMAAEAEKSVRAALAEQMAETGATNIQTEAHTAYLSRRPAYISVDQDDLVPAEYMRQPPPAPDKKAIKAAIEAGQEVPGCSLIRPNDTTLGIRARKD